MIQKVRRWPNGRVWPSQTTARWRWDGKTRPRNCLAFNKEREEKEGLQCAIRERLFSLLHTSRRRHSFRDLNAGRCHRIHLFLAHSSSHGFEILELACGRAVYSIEYIWPILAAAAANIVYQLLTRVSHCHSRTDVPSIWIALYSLAHAHTYIMFVWCGIFMNKCTYNQRIYQQAAV